MKKDYVFFCETVNEQGLTSTSARYICNIANEVKRNLAAFIEGVSFVNTSINMPMSPKTEEMTINIGYNHEKLMDIPGILKKIGDINSLIAWLNEAIKARESLVKELNSTSFKKWLDKNMEALEEPEFKTELAKPELNIELKEPKRPEIVSNDRAEHLETLSASPKYWICDNDIIASMNIKERNRLLELNSRLALYGKYIGKSDKEGDGYLLKARKQLLDKTSHEFDVEGSGDNTVITHYTPSVDISSVDSVYFSLQAEHRAMQAEYNGLVRKIEIKGQELFNQMMQTFQEEQTKYETNLAAARKAYKEECDKYDILYATERREFNEKMDAYNSRKTALTTEYKQWLSQENQRIMSLKIRIPADLTDTYEWIKNA